jgi:squalene synthase HpnC
MGERAIPPGGLPSELERVAARAAGQEAGENFPVALRLLPPRPRSHLRRVYAYARLVDDVGDSARGDRLALLALIDNDVRALFDQVRGQSGGPRLAIVRDLRAVVDECALPPEPLLDLIEANRVDQVVSGYETFGDLLGYCRLSAAPVGRMVLHIAGAVTARNIADSDAICAALQVLEHCQDVREDAVAGRVYLPAADLRVAGIQCSELRADSTNARLRQVIAQQVDRAAAMLGSGPPLVRRLSGWSRLAVAGYVAGGLATVDALRRADHEVHARHVRPSKRGTALHAIRLITGR